MIQFTSDENIFITYGDRSANTYWSQLSEKVIETFGNGPFKEGETITKVFFLCYDFVASKFLEIVHQTNDTRFVYYLFANHESSIKLYLRRLGGEQLEETEGIIESDLALNRRILKLALEQTCDVSYTNEVEPNSEVLKGYVEKVEDLLYLGEQLYRFAEHLAEGRMISDCNILYFDERKLLRVERKNHYDEIYQVMNSTFETGFKEGIFDTGIVKELRTILQECMEINYDFAGSLIFQIKNHHSPGNIFQTVEPSVLPANLINSGVDKETAENFYNGLTISRHNKLKITDAVYQVNSFERHMFRPILILNFKGVERALIGEMKWGESIMVMATNGFQWQRAPWEWLENKCFKEYLSRKALEHDKLLEDEVESILKELGKPYRRTVKSLKNALGVTTDIEISTVGEMDFIFIDNEAKRIIMGECKYNRARYEMVGFSTDFKNFQKEYEPKLERKVKWLKENKQLIKEHFKNCFPDQDFNIDDYKVEGIFIINTPTFYMMNGKHKTVSINRFKDFVVSAYEMPVLKIKTKAAEGMVEKEIKHPYFTEQ